MSTVEPSLVHVSRLEINVSEILRSNGTLNKVLILSTFYIKMFCERDIFVVSSSSIKFWKISKMFGQLFHGIFTTIKNIWSSRDNVLRQNRLSNIREPNFDREQ